MATYDGKDYLDMDIDKVILGDKEIIIKAELGESALREGMPMKLTAIFLMYM